MSLIGYESPWLERVVSPWLWLSLAEGATRGEGASEKCDVCLPTKAGQEPPCAMNVVAVGLTEPFLQLRFLAW